MKPFKYEYVDSKRRAILRLEKLKELGFDGRIYVIRADLVEIRYWGVPKVEEEPVIAQDDFDDTTGYDYGWQAI